MRGFSVGAEVSASGNTSKKGHKGYVKSCPAITETLRKRYEE